MIRKILKFFLSKKQFEKIKSESKSWFFICTKCGFSRSIWEAGGIRVGATSKGKKEFGHCPKCNKIVLFDVIKK